MYVHVYILVYVHVYECVKIFMEMNTPLFPA